MQDLDVNNIIRLIEEFKQSGKTPEKIEIGFKTYAKLVDDDQFYVHVTKSADSKHRMFKNIRIKLVTEKHYFKVK